MRSLKVTIGLVLLTLASTTQALANPFQWIMTRDGVEFSWASQFVSGPQGSYYEAILRVTNLTSNAKDLQFRTEFTCSTGGADNADRGTRFTIQPYETRIGAAGGMVYRPCQRQGGYPMRASIEALSIVNR